MAKTDKSELVKGIDLSAYDGVPDFAALKKAGIAFVIVRAGYGQGNEDPTAKKNLLEAKKNGIPAGAYWFSYALNREDALREAEECIACLSGYSVELPVFYDFEYDTVRYAKDKGVKLGKKEYNAFAEAFLGRIAEAGYIPGIYYNPDFLRNYVDEELVKRKGYIRWLAHYVEETSYAFDIWQNSGEGVIPGVAGKFDTDYLAKTSLLPPMEENGEKEENGLKTVNIELTVLSKKTKESNPRSQVRTLQRLLRELGVDGRTEKPLAVDGSYGGNTEYAVRSFQKSKGLSEDGVCGRRTWSALLL